MQFGIDWRQPSTLRGLVWVLVAVVGLVMIALGKDDGISNLLLLGSGIAGGLGVTIKDP